MTRKREDLINRLEANAYALELTIQSNHDRKLALLLREAATELKGKSNAEHKTTEKALV